MKAALSTGGSDHSSVNPRSASMLSYATAEQIKERLALQDGFMREIVERGRVAYEADHA